MKKYFIIPLKAAPAQDYRDLKLKLNAGKGFSHDAQNIPFVFFN